MRQTPLHEIDAPYVDDVLSEQSALFNPAAVAKLKAKARSGPMSGFRDNAAFVGILSSQLWHRQFVGKTNLLTNAA